MAIKGLCPRCGAKTLFTGPIKFTSRCTACGLDFTAFNVGDGPAAFLTFLLGGLLVGLSLTLELTVEPPLWLLDRYGPSDRAFTFKLRYPAPDAPGIPVDMQPDPWCVGHA